MASPKNYERQEEVEERTRPFVWRHRSGHPEIRVKENYGPRGDYAVSVPAHPPDYRQEYLGYAGSKEQARKMAVDWMREHPQGDSFQVERM